MTGQTAPMIIYLVIVMIAAFMPYVSQIRDSQRFAKLLTLYVILIGAAAITINRRGLLPVVAIVTVAPLIGLGPRGIAGGIAAIALFCSALWWPESDLNGVAIGAFMGLALLTAFLPRIFNSPTQPAVNPSDAFLPFFVCLAIGMAVGLLTGPFVSPPTLEVVWHHWGAYLSPAEAWSAGGLPWRDFPIQYGLGPTALIRLVGAADIWRGVYWVTVVTNGLYFATLATCALFLTKEERRGFRWLSLLALFCACFLWTAFPMFFASSLATPSVGGLRFLPISAMLLYIIASEHGVVRRDWIGHLLWCIDLIWSPEAAFFGTFIWWPYLALRAVDGANGFAQILSAIARVVLQGIGALILGCSAVALIVWKLSGYTAGFADFLVYLMYPPGLMNANPAGPIWIALAAIGLALRTLAKHKLSASTRPVYVCLLGLVAAGSYFLSRSHDNNILNLFPLVVLLLIAVVSAECSGADRQISFARGFTWSFLASILAFVATFEFGYWQAAIREGTAFRIGPAKLLADFSPRPNDPRQFLNPDAIAALVSLRAQNAGAVILLDDDAVMPWAAPGTSWNGVNNVANFRPLPRAIIELYIRRGAMTYNRPGWVVVDRLNYGDWLDMFRTAYDVAETKNFGTYDAYYLTPRRSVRAAPMGQSLAQSDRSRQ